MRWLLGVGLAAGLALATLLVRHFGAPAVADALGAAGARGVAVLAVAHLVPILLTGLAWQLLADPAGGPWLFAWARLLRDSAAEALPLSQIGGFVVGARALVLHGMGGATAVATTVVDVTVEMSSQLAYTAIGLGLLLWLRPSTGLALPVIIGLAVALIALAGFVAVQRRGTGIVERLASGSGGDRLMAVAASAEAVRAAIADIHRHDRRLCSCFLLHLVAWLASGAEAWLALRLMGVALDFAAVLVLESLLLAVRSITFIVPNSIGVQEGAYIMLGGALGLTPDIALALSLLKRGRDLVLGIPALLVWQSVETHRLLRRPLA